MLEGWEWIIIGVVAIVIILWGPAKIPEFAKALGRAKGEFSKASKEFKDAAIAPEDKSGLKGKDEVLMETAHNMGISTVGKTREQLTSEIQIKLKTLASD